MNVLTSLDMAEGTAKTYVYQTTKKNRAVLTVDVYILCTIYRLFTLVA